jgi:hypothetical protein
MNAIAHVFSVLSGGQYTWIWVGSASSDVTFWLAAALGLVEKEVSGRKSRAFGSRDAAARSHAFATCVMDQKAPDGRLFQFTHVVFSEGGQVDPRLLEYALLKAYDGGAGLLAFAEAYYAAPASTAQSALEEKAAEVAKYLDRPTSAPKSDLVAPKAVAADPPEARAEKLARPDPPAVTRTVPVGFRSRRLEIHLAPQTMATMVVAAVLGGLCTRGPVRSTPPLTAPVETRAPSLSPMDGDSQAVEAGALAAPVAGDAGTPEVRGADAGVRVGTSAVGRTVKHPNHWGNDAGEKPSPDSGGGR